MISNNQLKFIHSLRQKKFRDKENAFSAEGTKLVDELLASDFEIRIIYALSSWYDSRREHIIEKKIAFQEITESELVRASGLATPNEVLAIVSIPKALLPAQEYLGDLVLILDRIQDPGNMGTIIRTADWFGIRYVICSPDTVEVFNPKVVQSTMGSICRVIVHYADLTELINNTMQGRHLYAATAGGDNVFITPLKFPAAILIGNESRGISAGLKQLSTARIGIPSYSSDAESLNASVAAGILCAEFRKRLNNRL